MSIPRKTFRTSNGLQLKTAGMTDELSYNQHFKASKISDWRNINLSTSELMPQMLCIFTMMVVCQQQMLAGSLACLFMTKKTTFIVLAVLYILFEPKIVRAERDFQAFFFYHQFIALFHSYYSFLGEIFIVKNRRHVLEFKL